MRKNTRMTSKKVYISEAEEQERIKKTEAKKAIIKAEFEKYKKELKVNIADPSKTNEIRLKNQLEELLAANMKKTQELQRLENSEHDLEKQNMEATYFYEALGKSSISKTNETFISAGFHPNRTISRMDGVKESNKADALSDKKAQLMEMLSNIELLIEQEDEAAAHVQDRLEELKKNEVLINQKINELNKMHNHAEKRFVDLQRIEFLALTKQATTENNLKELKGELRDLRNQETAYMMQKEEEKKRELNILNLKQNEISNVLIELDKKRQEHQQKQEEVKKLELQYEDVRDKRKNTKIVTKYIEALNALHGERNLVAAHLALKSLSERLDASRDQSPFKRPSTHEQRGTPHHFEETPKRLSRVHDDSDELTNKRDSLLDRNYYIEKIRKFNEDYPEGPDQLAENLIQQYQELCYKEESWKTYYEELQNTKKNQENLLQSLQDELSLIKGKNEYITMGRSGSKILDSNEQEAIDSGMVVINSEQTTLNQAKFDFENKKESDNHLDLFTQTEAFVMRCYLDSTEMIYRFSKLLSSISNQATGYVSEDFRDFASNISTQILSLKKGKKIKQQELSTSQAMSDGPAQPGTQTDDSSTSDKDTEPLVTIDLQEIYDVFLGFFEGCAEEASEFITKLRSDVIIASFITVEDVKAYLQNYQTGILVETQIQKVFKDVEQLRKISIENMLQKFEVIYKLYMDITAASELASKEVRPLLEGRGVRTEMDQIVNRKAESNIFVKKALEKKWQNLMDRYEYDPTRDYRKSIFRYQGNEQDVILNKRLNIKENNNYEKETYDREDIKAKLNEMRANGSKGKVEDLSSKTFFRQNEEEKKRFQAKKAQEKQKQAIENMTDEDFLNFQRKQIKDVKVDCVYEINEGQLLMKAQADLADRLSQQAVPLEELKKMIENSKFISKIQILEKQKSVCDGKRSLKYEALENYIPQDPVKVPKSLRRVSQDYKIRTARNTIFTPTASSPGAKFFAMATDRARTDTEVTDSPRDPSFRANTTRNTSRFKPQDFHLDFSSAQNLETEKSYKKMQRPNTLSTCKQWPPSIEESARKQTDKTTAANSSVPHTQRENKQKSKKNLLIQKITKNHQEKRFAKSQSQKIDLPKLMNATKKKVKLYKKKRNNSSDVQLTEQETINQFLSLQTDPLLKMVYSPSFFASGFPSATLPDDFDYKFDSYRSKIPGLLVSEKI